MPAVTRLFYLAAWPGEAVMAIGATIGLALIVGGLVKLERFSYERHRNVWIGGAILFTVTAVPQAWVNWNAHQWGKTLTSVYGYDVRVECRGWLDMQLFYGGAGGYVEWEQRQDGTVTHSAAMLSTQACTGMRAAAHGARITRNANGFDWQAGPHIAAHEAAHVGGTHNEAAAECAALTHIEPLLAELGYTADEARQYRLWYLAKVAPWMPGNYQVTETSCPAASFTWQPDRN